MPNPNRNTDFVPYEFPLRINNWAKVSWGCPAFLTGPAEIPYDTRSSYLRYIFLHTTATQLSDKRSPGEIAEARRKELKGAYPYSKIIDIGVTIPEGILNYARQNTENLGADPNKLNEIEKIIFGYPHDPNNPGSHKGVIVSFKDERKVSGTKEGWFDRTVADGERTAGAGNWNWNAIHICYVGGVCPPARNSKYEPPSDTRTQGQKDAMELIIRYYLFKYYYAYPPEKRQWLWIIGHNQVELKDCPSFWVPDWLIEIGIPRIFINESIVYAYPDEAVEVKYPQLRKSSLIESFRVAARRRCQ